MLRAWITPSQRDALLEAGWLDEAGVNRLRESHKRLLGQVEVIHRYLQIGKWGQLDGVENYVRAAIAAAKEIK